MYGKTMSIPDRAMPQWYRLASGLPEDDADAAVRALEAGGDPMDAKRALAAAITARYHGAEAAERAGERFRAVHGRRELPQDVPTHTLPAGTSIHLPALLQELGWAPSRSEARRRIAEGGVRVDGEPLRELDVAPEELDGRVLQLGRRFARLERAAR
jgi:tyrosyl-tRNA synthetase